MARVLVTGGAGFIGSALARRLARQGDEVLVLDREQADLFRLDPVIDRVRVHVCDLFDRPSWVSQVREFEPERVFHLAWFAVPGEYLTSPENLVHLDGGIALTRELLSMKPRQFTITGTCFEYEMGDQRLCEDQTLERPEHLYSACKLAFKNVAMQLAADAEVPLTWARVFYLWGPYEDPRRLVPFLVRSLAEGKPVALRSHGRQLRDFVHVEDVASGLDIAATLGHSGVVNIGSGQARTVREIALAIGRAFGREELVSFAPDDAPFAEPMRVEADASKLRGLGWNPERSFDLASLADEDVV